MIDFKFLMILDLQDCSYDVHNKRKPIFDWVYFADVLLENNIDLYKLFFP